MARPSNIVLTVLNVISLVAGIALFATGIYLSVVEAGTAPCQTFLRNSLLVVGALLILVSLLGLVGSSGRNNLFMWLYALHMLLLVAGVVGFTIFMLVVTSQRHHGHRGLGDFSPWLRHHFAKGKNWDLLRSCLAQAQVCSVVKGVGRKLHNSALMVGCCKPPPGCGAENSLNATLAVLLADQTTAAAAAGNKNGDCGKWSGDPKTMCYNCDTCKAGFLGNIRKQWRAVAVALACFLAFIVLLLSIAWCAIANNKFDLAASSPHP
ncbi:unnamed protein product [Linum tenue]|uniref:Uncharacterized protein n=1 Tax=Linum tenue TaxID=586396 RepID=A0AAV0H703_9ROSI|nr:unnamed protein product [Linum tenue]